MAAGHQVPRQGVTLKHDQLFISSDDSSLIISKGLVSYHKDYYLSLVASSSVVMACASFSLINVRILLEMSNSSITVSILS